MTLRWNLPERRPAAPAEAALGAAAGGAGVLDAQALARLGDLDPGGKAGLVKRVLGTYVLSLTRLLEQLRTARAGGDHEGLRHAAHTLKSSSASVGALRLSELCAGVESRVRDRHLNGLDDEVARLLGEGERVLAGLKDMLPAP